MCMLTGHSDSSIFLEISALFNLDILIVKRSGMDV